MLVSRARPPGLAGGISGSRRPHSAIRDVARVTPADALISLSMLLGPHSESHSDAPECRESCNQRERNNLLGQALNDDWPDQTVLNHALPQPPCAKMAMPPTISAAPVIDATESRSENQRTEADITIRTVAPTITG